MTKYHFEPSKKLVRESYHSLLRRTGTMLGISAGAISGGLYFGTFIENNKFPLHISLDYSDLLNLGMFAGGCVSVGMGVLVGAMGIVLGKGEYSYIKRASKTITEMDTDERTIRTIEGEREESFQYDLLLSVKSCEKDSLKISVARFDRDEKGLNILERSFDIPCQEEASRLREQLLGDIPSYRALKENLRSA